MVVEWEEWRKPNSNRPWSGIKSRSKVRGIVWSCVCEAWLFPLRQVRSCFLTDSSESHEAVDAIGNSLGKSGLSNSPQITVLRAKTPRRKKAFQNRVCDSVSQRGRVRVYVCVNTCVSVGLSSYFLFCQINHAYISLHVEHEFFFFRHKLDNRYLANQVWHIDFFATSYQTSLVACRKPTMFICSCSSSSTYLPIPCLKTQLLLFAGPLFFFLPATNLEKHEPNGKT